MHSAYEESSGTIALDDIIKRHYGKPGGLLGILEEAQEAQEHRYLPENTLRLIAGRTSIPLSQIYSVVTFYSFFSLEPQGKHTLVVCRGTACHTRGSREILETAMESLGFRSNPGDDEGIVTSPDGFISIKTVACFGQCALAPVIMCDGTIRSAMTAAKTVTMLRTLQKGDKR